MYSAEMVFLIRGAERLIIVGSAILSLYLGYRLFIAGIVNKQSGEFSSKSFSVKLLNVGPGVFFALFGTFVLVVMISASLNVFENRNSDGTQTGIINYFSGQERSRMEWAIEEISAIKTMINNDMSRQVIVAALTSSQKTLARVYLGDDIYQKCEFGPQNDRDNDCTIYDQLIK